jgi:acyl carrier protein
MSTTSEAGAPTVELVASQIVAPVLGVATIGPDQDFFDLEATSLHMVQIAARAYQLFDVEVPLPELFDQPTVTGLVWLIERELGQA